MLRAARIVPGLLASFLLAPASLVPRAGAATILVPSQRATIQLGINAAVSGDTVLVACGTYLEHDIVMRSGVTLRSAGGDPSCVTIDGQDLGRVASCIGASSLTRFEGLTFTGGRADGAWPATAGGGIYLQMSSPAFTRCHFVSNFAQDNGGGAFCYRSPATFTDCVFDGNYAGFFGGGLEINQSTVNVTNSTFSNNVADQWGGGVRFHQGSAGAVDGCSFIGNQGDIRSGGFEINDSSPVITNCLLEGNTADFGAGMYIHRETSFPSVTDSEFRNNVANQNGGGLYIELASPVLTRCLFAGNRAAFAAGGVELDESGGTHGGGLAGGPGEDGDGAVFVECTFTGNLANRGGAARSGDRSAVHFTQCTFYANTANVEGSTVYVLDSSAEFTGSLLTHAPDGVPVACAGVSSVTILCSNVFGNAEGNWVACISGQGGANGNMSADPLYCGAPAGDFTLHAMSPCLDAAGCGRMGAWGEGCGVRTGVAGDPFATASWGSLKARFGAE